MDIASQLQSHPLFATFSPEALAEAIRAGTPVTYQPGDICLRQGDPGEVFGVLISGQLAAVRTADALEPVRLGTIGPGECFGEMSLLTGNRSSADVVALEESHAVVFAQEVISPLIAMNPEAVRYLARLMSTRLAPSPGVPRPARPSPVRLSLGAAVPMRVLAVTCRKDDIRYSYFDTTSEEAQAGGRIDGLGPGPVVHTFWGPRGRRSAPVSPATHEAGIEAMLAALAPGGALGVCAPTELNVIGHRVCHGGARYSGPVLVDSAVKEEVARLAGLAPLDNPYNLAGIAACERLVPGVPQAAVFDTAFLLRLPPAAHCYALPRDLCDDPELRRFGFHGISHEGAARAAAAFLGVGLDALSIVTCHLGLGASMAAVDHGRPVETTMGMTPLEGLVMATRPGDLDPGLILHLILDRGVPPEELRNRLYTEAGLLGLSGVSGDLPAVLDAAEQGDPRALLAVQVFCHRARKHLGSCLAALGGADAIVFTGGVGENAAGVRARVCQNLDRMGIRLDEGRNRMARVRPGEVVAISPPFAPVRVLVVGSNEEHTIARHAVRAVSQKRTTDVIRRQTKPIPISVSAHHVHLTPEHTEVLFGAGHQLTWYADLSQPGQYACQEMVTLVGPKGRIERVRVLGPTRPESQVEISRTEEFRLGIDAPVRMSGDLKGTPGITLEGPCGQVRLDRGVICAMRHIHMSPQDAMEFAIRDRDVVRVRVPGERSLVFGDVTVRVSPDFRLDMHIDTDEANAAEIAGQAVGYLDSIQERASTPA